MNLAEANTLHEASFSKLNCTKACETYGWGSIWNADEAIKEKWLGIRLGMKVKI